jgi:SpoU rRNA methylase family enzyme
MISEQPTSIFRSQAVDPVESLSQALEVLNGTVTCLSDVQSRAMRHVSFLSVCPTLFHCLHICMVGWRREIHFKTSDWTI